jgi:hypothetical protein
MKNNKEFSVEKNKVIEISLKSSKKYRDPFNEVELDVIVTDPNDIDIKIPAFWAGGDIWRFRFSSSSLGEYKFVTRCSVPEDSGINGREGIIRVSEYRGNNPLYKHGRLKISKDNRHLEHLDGNPFFWLADTWWYGFTKRFKWPEDFKLLTRDRADKGFSVVQIVCGLYYHSIEFNDFGSNEAGWPWDEKFDSINPYYFDFADKRIDWLINSGIMPCIVGAWGFHLHFRGINKIKKHWRYIIARWGAYPVVWCIAGESRMIPFFMPFFKHDKPLSDVEARSSRRALVEGWQEVSRFISKIDPYKNLRTVHPCPCAETDESYSSRDVFYDISAYDIDFLQTGHFGRDVLEHTLKVLRRSIRSEPAKPVINGEPLYEGIMGCAWQDTQRFLFWTHILSGAAGHSYGAQGIFSMLTEDSIDIFNQQWGSDTWKEAYQYIGSYQIGIGKRFLEKFEWNKFEPHPEWINPHSNLQCLFYPYASGIPKKVRMIYIPTLFFLNWIGDLKKIKIVNLEQDIKYFAYYFDPRKGIALEKFEVKQDKNGEWTIPCNGIFISHPTLEDWILVLEAKNY